MLAAADVVLCLFVASVTLGLWRVGKEYIKRSPLDAIPGPPSESLLKGNVLQALSRDGWQFLDRLTNNYGQVVRLSGFFGARALWVFDPKALQHIILKDQDVYEEAPFVITTRNLAFGPGLLSTLGDHHRRQRKLLNPVFSIANMREMTPIFYETVHRLQTGIRHQLKTSTTNEIDILNWMGRTALELIGQGGFGHSFDPLIRNVPNDYGDAIKALMPTLGKCRTVRLVVPFFEPMVKLQEKIPALKHFFSQNFHRIPDPNIRQLKTIVDTMDRTSRTIYEDRKRALNAGEADLKLKMEEGKDLMSVLLRANMMASEEDRLPEEEILAQMSTLTAAGTDTTSNGLARILHLLTLHPEAQDRLRAEILEAQNANGGDDLQYDDLVELPYLDAVCRETLRLYPPAPSVTRQAMADMTLPLSAPLTLADGTTTNSIFVPKGTRVIVGIYSCNRNKAIWGDDAEEWKPDRWLDGSIPSSVSEARVPGVYSNLMTFLGGGRACIGFKFSQLEMKVVLSVLLSSFRFSLASGEKSNIVWNRAGVAYPSVGKGGKPSMYLAVESLSA